MTGVLCALVGGQSFAVKVTANATGSQAAGSPSGNVTTSAGPTFTISGGTSPFTYNNTIVTPDGTYGTPSVTGATTISPTFNDTVNALSSSNSTWRLTVTDAASRTATVDYSVTLTNTSV